jgi:hypothetical protein
MEFGKDKQDAQDNRIIIHSDNPVNSVIYILRVLRELRGEIPFLAVPLRLSGLPLSSLLDTSFFLLYALNESV